MRTREELEARLEELRPQVEEYEALCFEQMVSYLEDEGFIECEGSHVFMAGEAVTA